MMGYDDEDEYDDMDPYGDEDYGDYDDESASLTEAELAHEIYTTSLRFPPDKKS